MSSIAQDSEMQTEEQEGERKRKGEKAEAALGKNCATSASSSP